MKEFEYIRLRILPAGYLKSVGNVSTTLLETGYVARVDPKDPRIGRSISHTIGIFDSKLRFSFQTLAVDSCRAFYPHPTPPRPARAIRDPSVEPFSSI
jgi:hypothetical protein